MRINHVCVSCGQLLAVCEHANYRDLKTCWHGRKKLCETCSSYPGSPLLSQERRRVGRVTSAVAALRSALTGPGRLK
jgi:hypothetical protein